MNRNLKLKRQKRSAILLATLNLLYLMGCKSNDKVDIDTTVETTIETTYETTEATTPITYENIEIVDQNGVVYPTDVERFVDAEFDGFAKMPIPLYDSFKYDKEIIDVIPQYQTVDRLYSDGEFSYVKTEDGKTGYVHDELLEILPDSYIEVDLSEQRVIVVYKHDIVLDASVVTGKPGTETNVGYTEVLSKTYNRPLIGPGYRLDVQYFIHFNTSEEGFHDNHNRYEFGGDIYMTNGSHGCVNMRLEDVKVMDEYTSVGTKVLVHK